MQHNILLLIPTFADAGGTQKMVCELGKLFAKEHKVFECSFNAYNEPHVFTSENLVLSLEISAQNDLFTKARAYILAAKKLKRLKKQYGITITISNLWSADLLNILSGGNDKKISIGHGSIVGFKGNKLLLRLRYMAAFIYQRFNKVVAVNKLLEQELKELFQLSPNRLTTINNFISFPKKEIDLEVNKYGLFRLITVGRLDVLKNHAALIAVFAKLKKCIPAVQLVIVGSGAEEQALKSQSKSLGLTISESAQENTDIIFSGFQSDPFPLLSSSDLFVFPTRTEGLPLVLVEAMFCGLPVIASDCPAGGPSLILQGKGEYLTGRKEPLETDFGFLMPIPEQETLKGITQWTEVIHQLLLNKEKRNIMSQNSRRRALDFSAEKAREQWYNLIHSLS